MRVVFLCSCLEPGADGVGDYTRRLAGELIRRGHSAAAVALHDSGTRIAGTEEPQESEGASVPVLRLSPGAGWPARAERARKFVDRFQPEWVSVQFVCFGYHPKGLPIGLMGRMRRIAGSVPVHWMFHELWVGRGQSQPAKIRLWGMMQRRLVLSLYRQVRPKVTQTTIEPYAAALRRHGIQPSLASLFGNIPLQLASGRFRREIERLGIAWAHRESWLLLGMFGSAQWDWRSVAWLDHLLVRAEKRGRKVALLGIGRVAPAGAASFLALGKAGGDRLLAHHFGPQPAEDLSEFLQLIDLAISPMERSALEKSGAAAAMREHDVPILIVRVDDEDDQDLAQVRVLEDIDRLLDGLGRTRFPDGGALLKAAADDFVVRLEAKIART